MKHPIKAVIAFSTLALAMGGALAQTAKPDSSPSATPAPSSHGSARPAQAPEPKKAQGDAPSATAQGPGAASGTRGAAGGPVTFQSLDADNNGKVSKAEASAAPDLEKVFSRLDKNKDGSLDQAEFSQHKSK